MRRPLLSLTGLGIALRLAVPVLAYWATGSLDVYFEGFWRDSRSYLQLADSLLETGEYQFQGNPELFRPPGFPVFLIPAVASGHPLAATVILNAALGGLTVALAYATARTIAGDRAAWWAGFLCAIELGQILHSGFVMAEPLFTALVAAIALAGILYLRSGTHASLLALGLAVAGAAYVKTIAYFLPLWVAGAMALLAAQPAKRRAAHVGLFLVVAVIPIAVWHARNMVTAGYPGFSTQIPRAALYREAASLVVVSEGVPMPVAREREAAAVGTDLRDFANDPRFTSRMWARFAEIVRDDVPGFVTLHVYGGLKVLAKPWEPELLQLQVSGRPRVDIGVMQALVTGGAEDALEVVRLRGSIWVITTILSGAILGGYLLCAALAMIPGPSYSQRIWLTALAMYFVMLASGTAVFYDATRFRVPIMPIVSVLAGCSIARFGKPSRRQLQPGMLHVQT